MIPVQTIKDLERAANIIDTLYKADTLNTKLANASRLVRKSIKRMKK